MYFIYSSWKDYVMFCGNWIPNQDYFPGGSCSTWNGTGVQAASDSSGIHFGFNIDRIIGKRLVQPSIHRVVGMCQQLFVDFLFTVKH